MATPKSITQHQQTFDSVLKELLQLHSSTGANVENEKGETRKRSAFDNVLKELIQQREANVLLRAEKENAEAMRALQEKMSNDQKQERLEMQAEMRRQQERHEQATKEAQERHEKATREAQVRQDDLVKTLLKATSNQNVFSEDVSARRKVREAAVVEETVFIEKQIVEQDVVGTPVEKVTETEEPLVDQVDVRTPAEKIISLKSKAKPSPHQPRQSLFYLTKPSPLRPRRSFRWRISLTRRLT